MVAEPSCPSRRVGTRPAEPLRDGFGALRRALVQWTSTSPSLPATGPPQLGRRLVGKSYGFSLLAGPAAVDPDDLGMISPAFWITTCPPITKRNVLSEDLVGVCGFCRASRSPSRRADLRQVGDPASSFHSCRPGRDRDDLRHHQPLLGLVLDASPNRALASSSLGASILCLMSSTLESPCRLVLESRRVPRASNQHARPCSITPIARVERLRLRAHVASPDFHDLCMLEWILVVDIPILLAQSCERTCTLPGRRGGVYELERAGRGVPRGVWQPGLLVGPAARVMRTSSDWSCRPRP